MELKNLFLSLILILMIILPSGCKKEEFIWGQKVGNITYSGNVVFLGPVELSSLKEVTSDRLVFTKETGALSDITEMSILLAGVSEKTPYGFLREVNTVQAAEGGIVISTSDATLPEAIKEGTVKFSGRLLEKDFYLQSKVDGVLAGDPGKSFDGLAVTLDNLEIMKDGTKIARLNGAIGISPEIDITIIIKFNQVTKVTLSATLNKIDEVSINSNSAFNGTRELTAAEFTHTPVVIDSVVFVPLVSVKTGYKGSISSPLSTGVRQDRTITSEIRFEGLEWIDNPLDQTVNYDYISPVLTDNSDLEVFSEPEIRIMLFGIPLQTIAARGYYSIKARKNDSPFWRLSIGNDGQNSINSDILGLTDDFVSSLEIQSSEIGNSNSR
ncbi:MAG TPA: hypothetical protein PLX08_12140 [Bacteroidales bacterium]|jgi:hypothetical protein|nr:hypothetical protein [Bacteroidales bacterium]